MIDTHQPSTRVARPSRVSLVLFFGLQFSSAFAFAQGRPDPRLASVVPSVCTLLRSATLAPASPTSAPNPQSSLAIAATATGAIVAFRARGGDDLVVLRADDQLARAGEDRVVAGPVTAFALASSPGGAALVAAERVARDGRDAHDDILLARLDTAGNARNVPRSLARVLRCDGVAVRPSATGFMVAWGTLDGPATATVTTDPRGVPTARARVVVDASSPTLVSLTGETRFAMTVRAPTGASLLHLDESGASVEALPQSSTPVALVSLSSSVLSFAMNNDSVSLTRWWPGAGPTELSVAGPRGVAPGARVVSVTAERANALLLLDDSVGHEQLVRVSSDGATTLLATFNGSRGALAPSLDGSSLFVATHAPAGGIELQRWSCPRPATVLPASVVSSSTTAVVNAPDAGVPADANPRAQTP